MLTGLMTDNNSLRLHTKMHILFGLDFTQVILINKRHIDKYTLLYFSQKIVA